MAEGPLFSVITPVLDGGTAFARCLEALAASRFRDFEHLVVDDGCRDASPAAAAAAGARVLATAGRRGPAAARNLGAREATGEYLFFLDADCAVHPDTLGTAAAILQADPALEALFGSYDDRPAAAGTVSRFKNLFHHWVHQNGDEEAVTFWSGCGAVRRRTFLELGGFDEKRFSRPSIEDIELGYRITARGGRIRLAKQVQVTHHKQWTLLEMARTDLLRRGIPWTRLLLEGRPGGRELNLGRRQRLSVALSWALLVFLAASVLQPAWLLAAAAALPAVILLNRRLCRFFWQRGGMRLGLAAVPLLGFYFLYSGAAFLGGAAAHLSAALRRGRGASGETE